MQGVPSSNFGARTNKLNVLTLTWLRHHSPGSTAQSTEGIFQTPSTRVDDQSQDGKGQAAPQDVSAIPRRLLPLLRPLQVHLDRRAALRALAGLVRLHRLISKAPASQPFRFPPLP